MEEETLEEGRPLWRKLAAGGRTSSTMIAFGREEKLRTDPMAVKGCGKIRFGGRLHVQIGRGGVESEAIESRECGGFRKTFVTIEVAMDAGAEEAIGSRECGDLTTKNLRDNWNSCHKMEASLRKLYTAGSISSSRCRCENAVGKHGEPVKESPESTTPDCPESELAQKALSDKDLRVKFLRKIGEKYDFSLTTVRCGVSNVCPMTFQQDQFPMIFLLKSSKLAWKSFKVMFGSGWKIWA
ncbi:hypothetical protein K438DRAFT_1775901 [Mycena galopus ATCC 62051]|nr:hypothetical protein K438DRAFT_1775901 [Mycena galopus ATCC 62051]